MVLSPGSYESASVHSAELQSPSIVGALEVYGASKRSVVPKISVSPPSLLVPNDNARVSDMIDRVESSFFRQ